MDAHPTRRSGRARLLGVLMAVCGAALAAPVELDADVMRAIEDSNKSLASNIALKDVKASTGDARDLAQMFTQVEAHFAAKADAVDATTLARKSHDLALGIVESVNGNDFAGATDAATTLSRTCRTCHTFYKKS
ncbi:MAG: hypothetical protein V4857_11615 [Pseudomonadota bacterium]